MLYLLCLGLFGKRFITQGEIEPESVCPVGVFVYLHTKSILILYIINAEPVIYFNNVFIHFQRFKVWFTYFVF